MCRMIQKDPTSKLSEACGRRPQVSCSTDIWNHRSVPVPIRGSAALLAIWDCASGRHLKHCWGQGGIESECRLVGCPHEAARGTRPQRGWTVTQSLRECPQALVRAGVWGTGWGASRGRMRSCALSVAAHSRECSTLVHAPGNWDRAGNPLEDWSVARRCKTYQCIRSPGKRSNLDVVWCVSEPSRLWVTACFKVIR